ncbi:hypothetical protein IFM89_015238 [Coptis chinensis]|uniref:Nucleoside phosphorylase domain-containing protein n=1 Tax=Coptis chinensis TaxID=261450 RepID=A0A835HEZ2_9MAGN|nr:hypothetical protein IFM89_015238 [Coptis chinensis]
MVAKQAAPYMAVVVVVMVVTLVDTCVLAIPVSRQVSLRKVREVNREGPYIGLITVYPPEEKAFFATNAFQPHPSYPFIDLSGRRFRVGKIQDKSVIYMRCGVGTRNAATATQQMLDLFDISGIIHFGIAGNTNNSLSIGDVTIHKQFAQTGIWDWLKPNGTLYENDVAHLDIGNYNVPNGQGMNLLGRIGFSPEQFYSESGQPNTPERIIWANVSRHWLHSAAKLEGMELERCLNSSLCLPSEPKLVIGLRGSTADIFLDNAAYREFLAKTFSVSSVDMESAAVVMTSLSNGFPVIVIRGLSDLAGGQVGHNSIDALGPIAALNTAKVAVQFVKILPN